jgi:FkbM family methyltransferase
MRLRTALPVQEARESWDNLDDIEEGPPVPKDQVRKSYRTRKTQMRDLGQSSSFPSLENTTMIKMAVKKKKKADKKHFFWYICVLILTASFIKVWFSPTMSIIGPIIGAIPIPTWKMITGKYVTEIPSSIDWLLNVKGTDHEGMTSTTTDGVGGGGMLSAGNTDIKVDEVTANPNPAESLHPHSQEETTEILIGRSLLDDPETKSEAHLITCVNGAPVRRVLVREHLGIAKATAEDFFARFLPLMSEKHLVLDIGANTGQLAVPIASLGHKVISFEPNQSTCDILRKNLENANVANRVEIHCAPAAKLVETMFFHADPVFSARNGLISPEEAEVLKKAGRGSEVTTKTSVTVDLSVGDRDVFLLKTDTQGYEMSVLEGAAQVLKKGNVRFLLIEFSYSLLKKAGTSPIDLINYVYDHGYMCTYLGFHTVTQMVKGKPFFSMVDAPQFNKDELSVSFEMFVKSLEIVVAPDARYKTSGWSDLFCWKRCIL